MNSGRRVRFTQDLQFTRPASEKAGDADKPMLMEAMKALLK